jgi:hypothetical protein
MIRSITTLILASCLASADVWTDTFSIEKISPPPGVDAQIGGLATTPSGKLAACFHRGELFIYNPKDDTWKQFASGLHEPLGILAESDSSFLVMQRPELTRISDTDGDGVGDLYQTVFDDFGMTGNYHEFAFGLAQDKEGYIYLALGTASNGAGIREEIRGRWSPIGLDRKYMLNGSEWRKHKGRAGRMYSRVPYRGWVLKVSPDGSKWQPYASGFRSPEGLGFDRDGRLYVADNQGDWLGTSKIFHVREGLFYGHPASLVWKEGWNREPLQVSVAELEKLRTPAMGLLPQGELANSPTQPLMIPRGVFGGLNEQMLIGEMNTPTLVRFLPDPVGEVSQGAAIPFLRTRTLGAGNHRMSFTPDGSLWVAKTHLSWAGGEGLVRVRLKEKAADFLAIDRVKLTSRGFSLGFTQPVDSESLQKIEIARHTYKYHAGYGSPKVDKQNVAIKTTSLSPEGRSCVISLKNTGDLKSGYLYTIRLPEVRSNGGKLLLGDTVYYTLHAKR